jgi:hypothetical protein
LPSNNVEPNAVNADVADSDENPSAITQWWVVQLILTNAWIFLQGTTTVTSHEVKQFPASVKAFVVGLTLIAVNKFNPPLTRRT